MQAYRTYIVIENPQRVTLSNLPFRAGEHVEVLLIAHKSQPDSLEDLKVLLKETQALPHLQSLSEDDIAAEIAVYRSGASHESGH
jgi:hypothetical protein